MAIRGDGLGHREGRAWPVEGEPTPTTHSNDWPSRYPGRAFGAITTTALHHDRWTGRNRKGDACAQVDLGSAYANGDGVARDDTQLLRGFARLGSKETRLHKPVSASCTRMSVDAIQTTRLHLLHWMQCPGADRSLSGRDAATYRGFLATAWQRTLSRSARPFRHRGYAGQTAFCRNPHPIRTAACARRY